MSDPTHARRGVVKVLVPVPELRAEPGDLLVVTEEDLWSLLLRPLEERGHLEPLLTSDPPPALSSVAHRCTLP